MELMLSKYIDFIIECECEKSVICGTKQNGQLPWFGDANIATSDWTIDHVAKYKRYNRS